MHQILDLKEWAEHLIRADIAVDQGREVLELIEENETFNEEREELEGRIEELEAKLEAVRDALKEEDDG